jgi:hypothetical protein
MRLSASQAFFCEWQGNELVLQSWMAAHAGSGASDTLQRVHDIYNSSCFRLDVPNDVYALLVTFARSSPCQLYSTAGLALVVDAVLLLDKSNPQVAARLVRCFSDVHSLCAQECAGAVDSVRRIAAAAVSPASGFVVDTTSAHTPTFAFHFPRDDMPPVPAGPFDIECWVALLAVASSGCLF